MKEHEIKLVMVDGVRQLRIWRCLACDRELTTGESITRDEVELNFNNAHGGNCPGEAK